MKEFFAHPQHYREHHWLYRTPLIALIYEKQPQKKSKKTVNDISILPSKLHRSQHSSYETRTVLKIVSVVLSHRSQGRVLRTETGIREKDVVFHLGRRSLKVMEVIYTWKLLSSKQEKAN